MFAVAGLIGGLIAALNAFLGILGQRLGTRIQHRK